MTTDEILALARQALADDERAEPGPWRFETPQAPAGATDLYGPVDDESIAEWVSECEQGGYNATFITAARTREPQLAQWIVEVLGRTHTRSWFEVKGGEGSYSGVGVALTLFGKWHSIDAQGARALAAALLRAADEAERGVLKKT